MRTRRSALCDGFEIVSETICPRYGRVKIHVCTHAHAHSKRMNDCVVRDVRVDELFPTGRVGGEVEECAQKFVNSRTVNLVLLRS